MKPFSAALVRFVLAVLPAGIAACAPGVAAAKQCSKQSPRHTVALLELYTSEGCSSCPPADRFLSGFRHLSESSRALSGLTADQVVPLSLHVDYWDYIGWKDQFAQRIFTERQRWLSDLAATRTIYTPEIFVSGRELRNWRGGVADAVARINQRPAQAQISITVGEAFNDGLPVTVQASAQKPGRLFVALYENGLSSEVKSGENHGATLRHDYVVRQWLGPLELTGESAKSGLSQVLRLPRGAMANNFGVAAFVQADSGEVLQALALPLCGT